MNSEPLIKRTFTPALSKVDGKARLTFIGFKHSINKNEQPYMFLVFSCMDDTRENPANIRINCGYRYTNENNSKKNVFTRTLDKLGFVAPKLETVPTDDEFGDKVVNDAQTLSTAIYECLDNSKGLVFKAELKQGKNNLFNIDVDTLTPFLDKQSKQVRDNIGTIDIDTLRIDIDQQEDNE